MPYKHILAAVDLSDEAAQVLEKARAIADSHGAKLSLISVVKPLAQVYGGLDMAPIANGSLSFEKEALKKASQQMRDYSKIYRVDGPDIHVKIGNPAHETRDAASELEANLIVVLAGAQRLDRDAPGDRARDLAPHGARVEGGKDP